MNPSPLDLIKPYWLYLLECQGGSWYAGIAIDVDKRFQKHASGKGAIYTRCHPPIKILARKIFTCKGDALRAEFLLKKLPKSKKIDFFFSN